ncbi:hypothetical protein FVR03_19525 [Pontibacter qinzhouensis]|uniref:Cytochrome C oxidase subunit I n=1 Tax=Pontibacter qinzhouensis TaxID=2603253 RepID=A0A5C8J5Y3_9BACT|nr:hypothetical protein [Pontibacter qinzhouensis]TXK32808.1 hypothetical protein FVR03_19525 [Pontibacter qinzhouensis]
MYKLKTLGSSTKQWHSTLVRTRIALGYFVLVGALGLLLRWQVVGPIEGLNYKNFLHAHSHVALLGWLYCALFAALLYVFPPASEAKSKSFKRQFLITQVAVNGMLFSFPVQGYALFSIIFSTLHILLSYWFAWSFWRHVKEDQYLWQKHGISLNFIGLSLLFMVLSSIGPWAMGPIMATGGAGGKLYYSAIYFYLHFQYNGWFAFAVLGLFFWLLDHKGIGYQKVLAMRVLWLLGVACVPAVILSFLWIKPAAVWYWVSGAGAVLQVVALVYFLKLLWQIRAELMQRFANWVQGLFGMALFCLSVKLMMQLVSAFPAMADLAYQIRYFIIGYLHLSLLGFASMFLVGFFLEQKLYQLKWLAKLGLGFLVLFFVVTEALLFLQGTLLWLQLPTLPDFNLIMFVTSIGMPLGLLLFFFSQPGLSKTARKPAL